MRVHLTLPAFLMIAVVTGVATLLASGTPQTQQPPPQQPPPRQPGEVFVPLVGEIGAPPKLALAGFVALPGSDTALPDRETTAVAEAMSEVLWDDLAFEREFYLIPRDVVRTVPVPASVDDVQFDRWREIGADGLLIGTVQKTASGLRVQVRLWAVRSKESAFGKEYAGTAANPRLYAHTVADEMHMQQRRLRGVARTKLAIASDRDGARIPGPVDLRTIKEIYVSDYDGANQRERQGSSHG